MKRMKRLIGLLVVSFVLLLTMSINSHATEPFDYNWEYEVKCPAVLVTWPEDLPHDAIDINIRVVNLTPGEQEEETTFNFRNAAGWTKGEEYRFDVRSHPSWKNWSIYAITWVQVHGTNYHWEGLELCGKGEPDPISITVEKVWVPFQEFPENYEFPTVQVQLYRNNIAFLEPVTLVDGVTSHTWNDLPERDENDVPYEYRVDEVGVPEGFQKSVTGYTITNTEVGELPPTGQLENNTTLSLLVVTLGGLFLGIHAVNEKRKTYK